ncbi:LysR family transcriptional regulator [Paenibacillus piri]|uniref:LysR family transcriptional regulator n=1 Tax=Paenibacillus piri TaxID=2547395 RepID=A0A4R5KY61_9BACL|nr:LysR family transcriptional regulator [Paenibacillus piri]TDG00777.1 LysR family transcriptional regulator [Paenibacillus piri]
MEIRHLQCIAEIVRLGSFTKASEALHVTQPTISKMIKSLENELNIEVFVRDGRQLQLTDAGQAIFSYAAPILQLFEQLQAELHDLTYLNKGHIRIGLPPMAGASYFPEVLKRFQDRYRGIAITLLEDGAKKIGDQVAEGAIDVGVVLGPVDAEMFESFPLAKDRLKVILPLGHPYADKPRIALAELAEERFILFNSDFALHSRIINECRKVGFDPHIVFESSQWDFIGHMVGAGLGIAMLPDTVCRSLPASKVCAVPLVEPVIPWLLVMVWKRESYLSLAAREWIAFTKESFGVGAALGNGNGSNDR